MVTQTEIYRFTEQGSDSVWTYTSGDDPIVYNAGDGNETYNPVVISRSEVESRNEMTRANLDVTVSLTNPAALKWLADNGEKIVSLTIWERDRTGTFSVIWKGRLVGVAPSMKDIVLKHESIFTSLRRPGLRARYQRSCRHALYGRGCYLNPETFRVEGEVTALSKTVLTVPEAAEHPDGYFKGGMLRAADGTLSYVVNHVGATITIQRPSFALLAEVLPAQVGLYPGCPHTRQACNDKFDNIDNYGGFDFIPQKNPTGGSSIV